MSDKVGMFIFVATIAICGIVYFIAQMRPVRLFFLRRQHASILRQVEAEMQAEFGKAYTPDPERGERLWRQCLRIHGLE